MRILLSICLVMVLIIPCQAQKVKPQLNLTIGNTYYVVADLNSLIEETINNRKISVSLGISAKTANKVIDIQDSIYTLEVSPKRYGMKIRMPGQALKEYTSDDSSSTELVSKLLYAMLNKPYLVMMTKSGKVLAVKNIDKVIDGIFNSFTIPDTTKLEQLKSQFAQSFGEKTVKANLEQTFSIYPDRKVAINDKWVIDNVLLSTISAKIHNVFKLQYITPDYYIIQGNGKVTSNDNAVFGGMPVKYNLSGSIISNVKVDKITGWVTESDLTENISGNIEVKNNPKIPGGMLMPMNIRVNAIVTDK
jgi:hypothetical protein